MALHLKAATKMEEERTKVDELMDLLMKDEEVRRLLTRKIRQLYVSQSHSTS